MARRAPLRRPPSAARKGAQSSTVGAFAHLPLYIKLYDVMRNAYANYKVLLHVINANLRIQVINYGSVVVPLRTKYQEFSLPVTDIPARQRGDPRVWRGVRRPRVPGAPSRAAGARH